ncbi:hypothetical protein M404DRAFT_1007305 [Pisolithus tinctorius Marx 270]|uniref:Uncharacterized protein n=1 Tax=Pisolithus tinctorius Marx 270 TaxID=870435 RepID=A0A0C3NK11_PISTI|nr:hypothetical protein M404DRAFT_1007305 [Pisolithus tinctorius Marx 270]
MNLPPMLGWDPVPPFQISRMPGVLLGSSGTGRLTPRPVQSAVRLFRLVIQKGTPSLS